MPDIVVDNANNDILSTDIEIPCGQKKSVNSPILDHPTSSNKETDYGVIIISSDDENEDSKSDEQKRFKR